MKKKKHLLSKTHLVNRKENLGKNNNTIFTVVQTLFKIREITKFSRIIMKIEKITQGEKLIDLLVSLCDDCKVYVQLGGLISISHRWKKFLKTPNF